MQSIMVRKTKGLTAMFAGLLFFLIGAIIIGCTLPAFTHTRPELVQVPRSEVIIDSTFDLNQLQDKVVQFQIAIGQSLNIYASGNGNMSFSIVNFTKTNGVIQPDQPDIIYFFQNDTATINTTWSPQSRVADPGKYYLVFLARNASSDSSVHIYANATKTWTDYRLKDVLAEDRIPLLDQRFVYLGSAMAVFGTALFSITLSHNRRSRNHK
jgi:hypothetical protein